MGELVVQLQFNLLTASLYVWPPVYFVRIQLLCFCWISTSITYLFGRIQTSQTCGQANSATYPYGELSASILPRLSLAVRSDLAKFRHFGTILKVLFKSLWVYLVFGKMNYFWASFQCCCWWLNTLK